MKDKVILSSRGIEYTLNGEQHKAPLELLPDIFPSEPIVYPPNTRFHFSVGPMDLVVTEQKPMLAQVKTLVRKVDKDYKDYKIVTDSRSRAVVGLSLPYTVFIHHFFRGRPLNVHAFFRYQPLSSLDDLLWHCALPNTGNDGYLCIGSDAIDAIYDNYTPQDSRSVCIAKAVNNFHKTFWGTTFNRDLGYDEMQKVPEVYPLARWAHASSQDPNFGLKVKWRSRDNSLRNYIEDYLLIQGYPVGSYKRDFQYIHSSVFTASDARLPTRLLNQGV